MSGGLLTLVVYDVADDRRRTRLRELLRQYGVAVQKSAFEARLTDGERRGLVKRAARLVDPAADRVGFYTLAREQERGIVTLGAPRPVAESQPFFMV